MKKTIESIGALGSFHRAERIDIDMTNKRGFIFVNDKIVERTFWEWSDNDCVCVYFVKVNGFWWELDGNCCAIACYSEVNVK